MPPPWAICPVALRRIKLVPGAPATVGRFTLEFDGDLARQAESGDINALDYNVYPPRAFRREAFPAVDAVLLSHHQHADNLDTAGEAVLKRATRVVTTVEGAITLGGNAFGLAPWQSAEIEGPYGRAL